MSDRTARFALAVVVAVLAATALAVDLPVLAGGQFWGDGATYYSMAWSLAEDGDLRYEAKDLSRVKREFPSGPQGIFLKRASGGLTIDTARGFPWVHRVADGEPRIYFAKPFVYPLVAAVGVRTFGTRGLLLTNALALGLTLVLGFAELRRRMTPVAALTASLVLIFVSAAPVYLYWPAPELFNTALVAAGLAAWSRERPLLAALVLGVATYSKPYNLWLAIPLGISPLLPGAGGSLGRKLLESVRRGLALAVVVLALFGSNAAVTGEANYQGGRERKTFYGKFPLESPEATFGRLGIWMSTNQLGPRVEGQEDPAPGQGAEPPRSPEEIRAAFVRNLGYFWIGRFGGTVPYFFPVVLAMLLFVVVGPREPRGGLALLALVVSYVFYIAMIPDNWYGGSGTVGNRYFLNLLPLGFFLLPPGRERLLALGGLAGAVFVTPLLLAPMYHSLHHGAHATRRTFRVLPAELTMLNDLSVFSEPWRKKQPVGDTEGDPWRHWPADPSAYYLYFPDDGTHGKEEGPGGTGFWVRGGQRAEVFLRALEPVRRMTLQVTGGPAGDEVTVGVHGRRETASVAPGETRELHVVPGPGFMYKDSFVYVLGLRSRRSGTAPSDRRALGSFVRIALDVDKRPRR